MVIKVNITERAETLDTFVKQWTGEMRHMYREIPLFDMNSVKSLTPEQKAYFAKVFYHLRGHAHELLWITGSSSPNLEAKSAILDNYTDEFGKTGKSHEQLYLKFAKALDVDLSTEYAHEKFYLPFAREFNRDHLRYFIHGDWETKASSFAAIELLDNVDYPLLYSLGKSFGINESSLSFFKVHIPVEHYDQASEAFGLKTIWNRNSRKVTDAFKFIGEHQIKMWNELGRVVLSYNGEL